MGRWLSAVVLAAAVQAAWAQNNAIQWTTDIQTALNQARASNRPLLVYLSGSERDDVGHLDRDQKRAFKSARVLARAQRFVPLKLSRSTHRNQLRDFGFSETSIMELRFVTPDGEILGSLGANGVAQESSLAQKLQAAYQDYGRKLYEKRDKATLEDENAKPNDVTAALKQIAQFGVQAADATVIKLFERQRLDAGVRKAALETLAALSSKPSVDKLLELARAGDKAAEKAMEKCTPVAAEMMVADLKPDTDPFDYLAYKTAGTICRVPQLKPERFFTNSNAKLKKDEVDRVLPLIRNAATQWKTENE